MWAAFSSRWLKILLSCKIFQIFRSRLRCSYNKPLNFNLKRQKFRKNRNFCLRRTRKTTNFFKRCQKLTIFLIFPNYITQSCLGFWTLSTSAPLQNRSSLRAWICSCLSQSVVTTVVLMVLCKLEHCVIEIGHEFGIGNKTQLASVKTSEPILLAHKFWLIFSVRGRHAIVLIVHFCDIGSSIVHMGCISREWPLPCNYKVVTSKAVFSFI